MFEKKKATDPVCGMEVTVNDSTLRTTFNGKDYYFCAKACLTQFEADPNKYVSGSDEHCCGGGQSEECKHDHEGHDHHDHHGKHGHCNNGEEHEHKCHGQHHHSHH
ncbi:YHS domain-containing protein [Neobacillus sp. SM06]|uniref:YHS domain-containing protein n=1 Tax=Neobacillus sp. SM06 TaxID=3422492 RepID=UPI003D2DDFAA